MTGMFFINLLRKGAYASDIVRLTTVRLMK